MLLIQIGLAFRARTILKLLARSLCRLYSTRSNYYCYPRLELKYMEYRTLTWSRRGLLAGFCFNILYHFSKRSEGNRKHMTVISGYLPQLWFPVSSSNSQHEDLAAWSAQTTRWRAYTVLGNTVSEHNEHPFPTRCGFPWVKITLGEWQCLPDVGTTARIPQVVDSSQDGGSGVVPVEVEDGYSSARVQDDTDMCFSARYWKETHERLHEV